MGFSFSYCWIAGLEECNHSYVSTVFNKLAIFIFVQYSDMKLNENVKSEYSKITHSLETQLMIKLVDLNVGLQK